jgi:phage/plasmid-like protein (TIGR03299 family)
MYDMDRINALLGLPGNATNEDAADAAIDLLDKTETSETVDEVNIAEEIPKTATVYGHSMASARAFSDVADVDREDVERYLSWSVDRVPMTLHTGEAVKSHVANVRSDSRQVIGVVTTGFQTIQNQELIDLADAVRNDQQLRFCNAGVVNGGARVFFQCRGESFDVGNGDEVVPFMLFCNGHDGNLSCRMTPMSKRIWCQNQLGNIVKSHAAFVTIRHTGDTRQKIEEAKRLGRQYFITIKANHEAMLAMRDTAVKTEDMQKFYHECYSKHFGHVDFNAKTEEEQRKADRAKDGYADFAKRFDNERRVAGATVWNMANAYTGWLQHDKGVGKNPQKTANRRYESSLFGVTATRSVEAFRVALELVS